MIPEFAKQTKKAQKWHNSPRLHPVYVSTRKQSCNLRFHTTTTQPSNMSQTREYSTTEKGENILSDKIRIPRFTGEAEYFQ